MDFITFFDFFFGGIASFILGGDPDTGDCGDGTGNCG